MSGQPARYFAFGPYKAEAIGPYEWWGVKNKNGLNVLTFTDRLGHVFALEAEAKSLADEWNNGKVFEYPPEPEIKAALRLTDAQMAKYVFSHLCVCKPQSCFYFWLWRVLKHLAVVPLVG